MAEATNVKVYTRFRPFNKRETELGGDSSGYLGIDTVQHTVKLNDPGGHGGGATFTVDHVFDQTAEQEAVYDVVARPTVGDVFEGFNGTIFAYGQTGSGKTHTMMGYVEGDGSLAGLIPRASEQIFNTIASEVRGITFEVSVSYIEVYREVIRDLLDPSKVNLRVRESPAKGVYVDGMTQEFVTCEEEVLQVLAIGDESRAVAATNMNATSSRSHSILIVQVHQKNEEDGSSRKAQLNLVDLAGSEKISKTGATGDTLEEAKKINQSLSALSNVIKGLADGKEHVPYRDSKLTRILQSSLGGNTKTSLITAASPHPDNAAETLSTLRFGQRAKTIKTRVKANEQRSAEELAKIVEKLQVELAQLRGYTAALESKLSEVHRPPPPPPHHRCIHPPSLPNVFCCWIRAPLAPRPASFAPAARCCVAQRLCGTSCVCVPPAHPLSLCLSHSHAHSCVYRLASRCPRQRSPPPPPSRRAEG
jgi:kinesin family protein 5